MGTAILPSTSQMQTCHHLASVNCLSAFKLRDRPFHMPWRCLIFLAWEKHEYLFMCVQYNSFLACWICCTLSHSICFENKNLHNGRPLVCNDKHHKYHVIECQTSHRKIKGKEPTLSNPEFILSIECVLSIQSIPSSASKPWDTVSSLFTHHWTRLQMIMLRYFNLSDAAPGLLYNACGLGQHALLLLCSGQDYILLD